MPVQQKVMHSFLANLSFQHHRVFHQNQVKFYLKSSRILFHAVSSLFYSLFLYMFQVNFPKRHIRKHLRRYLFLSHSCDSYSHVHLKCFLSMSLTYMKDWLYLSLYLMELSEDQFFQCLLDFFLNFCNF